MPTGLFIIHAVGGEKAVGGGRRRDSVFGVCEEGRETQRQTQREREYQRELEVWMHQEITDPRRHIIKELHTCFTF